MIKQTKVTIKTTSAILTYSEMGDIVCNSIADVTITLPAPNVGLWYRISNVGTGIVTIYYLASLTTIQQTEQCLCLANATSNWFFSKGGVGVPIGGTVGQVLAKIDGTDYNTEWVAVAPATKLVDSNAIDTVLTSATAEAVNEITIKNAAITTNPQIQATGDDIDIGIELVPKGKGKIIIAQHLSTFTLSNFTTDHSWCGDTTIESVNEDAGLFGLLYLNAAGYKMAKADMDATLPCIGLQCVAGIGAKIILLRGYAHDDSWFWTVGNLLWVSPDTAGLITSTKPVIAGNRLQCIGYAVASNVICFNPNYVWVEV